MNEARNRTMVAGVTAGVLFAVGYLVSGLIPGGGGVSESDFADFYDSDARRRTALLLAFVLIAGCLAMVWFFTELRSRLPGGTLTSTAHAIAIVAAALASGGGAIMFGPAGVQLNSEGEFVGVNVAHAIAQSGLGVLLGGGMYSFAVALILFGVAFRRAPGVPGWFGIATIAAGVLLFGSYIWIPGFLLPIWAIVAGFVLRSAPERA